jgi:hypothetical protein
MPKIGFKITIMNKSIWFFIVIIVTVLLVFVFNKTGFSKKILNIINKDLIEANEKLKKESVDIQNIRIRDSINYNEALHQNQAEIELLKSKYNNSLKIIKKHEKAINDYRSGDFNNNFVIFTKLVCNDTL